MVDRSALLLKLLTSQKHGSLVAAPTFGLPERIGGERNWDYRYTWLRDSSFCLCSFMRLGFTEEAERFRKWLSERFDSEGKIGPLQVLYALDGRQEIPEQELAHLRGYRDSKPVRIGNAAYKQLQLDGYGEMFDAIYLSAKYGDTLSHKGWRTLGRSGGRRGKLHRMFLLVHRAPRASPPSRQGTPALRKDVRVCQRRRSLCRRVGTKWTASGEFSSGVHTFGLSQVPSRRSGVRARAIRRDTPKKPPPCQGPLPPALRWGPLTEPA